MRRIENRVAIVTGASRGLGAATARRLVERGARVALVARSEERLQQLAGELGALAVTADVTDRVALKSMIERVETELGPVDILVNNAGVENYGYFDDSSPAELEHLVKLNLTAPIVLSRMLVPKMVTQGFGHVVSLASTAGLAGTPYGAAYAATKAGLIAFTFSLRMEHAGSGVSASAVAPGFIEGDGMYEQLLRDSGGIRSPTLLGTTTIERVAEGVARAIERDTPEVILNSVPFRPAIGFGRTFPRLGLAFIRWIAGGYMKAIADARRKLLRDASR